MHAFNMMLNEINGISSLVALISFDLFLFYFPHQRILTPMQMRMIHVSNGPIQHTMHTQKP